MHEQKRKGYLSMSVAVVCVCCTRTVKQEDAYVVFKTGFYQAKYPLSVCCKCHEQYEEVDVTNFMDEALSS
jgi:hypothetical protein